MNKLHEQPRPVSSESVDYVNERLAQENRELPVQDDLYPGSFFQIPGAPITGKTTWSIN
ncbi:MAG: hypothetical protein ABL919_06165 [Methylococcales bacterium]|nr:hypothetical protein [Methylococcaceae bacterium]